MAVSHIFAPAILRYTPVRQMDNRELFARVDFASFATHTIFLNSTEEAAVKNKTSLGSLPFAIIHELRHVLRAQNTGESSSGGRYGPCSQGTVGVSKRDRVHARAQR